MPALSTRDAIAAGLAEGRISDFSGGLRDVAAELELTSPVSLRVMSGLLMINSKVFLSPEIVTGDVHAWGALGIQSDGLLSFRGHVHESGATGDNYFFAVALLDVKDSAGRAIVLPQYGNLNGQLDIGSSDDDFQNDGGNQLLEDQWDVAKNSRVQWVLHASTDPFQVTETLINGLIAVAAVVLGGYGASKCDWHAGTVTDPSTGEQRAGFVCHPDESSGSEH